MINKRSDMIKNRYLWIKNSQICFGWICSVFSTKKHISNEIKDKWQKKVIKVSNSKEQRERDEKGENYCYFKHV